MKSSVGLRIFVGLLVVSVGIIPGFRAQAVESQYAISLSCAPQATDVDSNGRFSQNPGSGVDFLCEAQNSQNIEVSLLVLGKQMRDGADLASSGSEMVLPANGTQKAVLSFPIVFHGGEYVYSFALVDKQTEMLLSPEFLMRGTVLDQKQAARILAVDMQDVEHAWGLPFELGVTVDVPQEDVQSVGLILDAVLQDVNGNECAVLLEKRPVMSTKETLTLVLPAAGTCVNSVVLFLSDSQGNLLDQKTLAIGLAEGKEQADSMLMSKGASGFYQYLSVFLVVTVLLVLAIVVSVVIRRKR